VAVRFRFLEGMGGGEGGKEESGDDEESGSSFGARDGWEAIGGRVAGDDDLLLPSDRRLVLPAAAEVAESARAYLAVSRDMREVFMVFFSPEIVFRVAWGATKVSPQVRKEIEDFRCT
jgi:hypothetical protein